MVSKKNIRGWIVLVFSILTVFIVFPFIIWRGIIDEKNLKERGKIGIATVIEVKGITGDRVVFQYEANGREIEKIRDVRRNLSLKRGDKLEIMYDSLDVENMKIIW